MSGFDRPHIVNNLADGDSIPNELAIQSISSASSISSSDLSINSAAPKDHQVISPVPIAYQDDDRDGDDDTPRSTRRVSFGNNPERTRSYSSTYTYAGQALGALRHTLSGTGSIDTKASKNLTRQSTSLSVRDIYGDMDDNEVRLRRTATRNTILNSLAKRVQSAGDEAAGITHDVEEKDYDGHISLQSISRKSNIYEDLPDTTVPTKDYGQEFAKIDPELVTWDGPDDPEYPRNWSTKQKVWQTTIVALYTFVSPITSSIPSPAMPQISQSLGMENNQFLESFSVSIMILAWALGPLVIAPISESDRVGRRPVLNASIWINLFFNLGCGFSRTPAQLCICRFLGGLGGCAALNVGAGTLADLWNDDQRLVAMAFYSICPTLGPVLSPVASSFIVANMNWRWVFHFLSIFNAAIAIVGTIFFRETYSPTLLYNKCQALKKETDNKHLHTIYEIADGETKWGQFMVTVSRPVKLLFTHPMVLGLGSFMAFTYGFMYLMIVTFPKVYKVKYGFSVQITGLMYLPMGVGYILGIIFFTIAIDKIYKKLTARNGGVPKPEYRLPCLCFSGVGIPVGLIWYGWSAEKELHWIMPAIGTAIYAFSFIAVFQTIQNYLIDMNNRFAASAVAAAAVFRSFFGFLFPLFANKMYDRLGYGWGNTMCGLVGLVLGLPFPIFCLMYGERLREWANRKMEEEQAKRDEKNLLRLKKLNDEKAF